jgi:peptide chain release factor 2
MPLEIPPPDLEISTYPPRDRGGQHVGISSGIQITHLPTGLVAICNSDRSQHTNKRIAMDMLLGGLTSPHFR